MVVSITGSQIPAFRLQVLLRGLELELKGLRISRGRTCYSIIKSEFGLKGSRQKVLEQFTKLLAAKENSNE